MLKKSSFPSLTPVSVELLKEESFFKSILAEEIKIRNL